MQNDDTKLILVPIDVNVPRVLKRIINITIIRDIIRKKL